MCLRVDIVQSASVILQVVRGVQRAMTMGHRMTKISQDTKLRRREGSLVIVCGHV